MPACHAVADAAEGAEADADTTVDASCYVDFDIDADAALTRYDAIDLRR